MKCILLIIAALQSFILIAQNDIFRPGEILPDNRGIHVNAHGGGILYHNDTYYWFGEHKGEKSSAAFVGVTCYSSDDLYNWKYESVALPVVKLVWADEFNYEGKPDPAVWSYENGFVRNKEFQWYLPENANCHKGVLTIEAKKEQLPNPNYEAGSNDWRKDRMFAEYTSACIKTVGKKEFLYGRFEVRAKIPTASGSWPAIWTLGNSMPWPSCGEIDVMEYYRIKDVPHILANTAWGKDQPNDARWNTQTVPFSKFTDKDPAWADKFHIWRMDWTEEAIRLYLDDELLNETFLKDTQNGSIGNYSNPFKQPHYLLLNLAIGGQNGGTPDDAAFPLRYEIDYVRIYQK
jgi:beta-glucanase (GH16 family)